MIGFPLPDWTPPPRPPHAPIAGRFCRLEPLDPTRHAEPLFDAFALDETGSLWTYLAIGPFASAADYRAYAETVCGKDDPLPFAILDPSTSRPIGGASYLRIEPGAGSVEIGSLCFSPLLQRTPAATEALFLLIRTVFELGYRRCEWKCDTLNEPSRAAATRLGFTFEGVFRQALVYKQRNRDTAWFSIIDREWPALEAAFERWLAPDNFDPDGKQKHRLSEMRRAMSAAYTNP